MTCRSSMRSNWGERLARTVEAHHDKVLFEAALVGLGRFGVVWSYVLEVHDETAWAVVEERSLTTWQDVRGRLSPLLTNALAQDEYLGFAVNPLRRDDRAHDCYVIRHQLVGDTRPIQT